MSAAGRQPTFRQTRPAIENRPLNSEEGRVSGILAAGDNCVTEGRISGSSGWLSGVSAVGLLDLGSQAARKKLIKKVFHTLAPSVFFNFIQHVQST